ncbi:MAG: hypothetical protein N3A38_14715 [Planctomycetota bacterium]|nr:hypothetical protein [Planctomycetota bacterium]
MELFRAVPGLAMTLDVRHACKPETLGLTHADCLCEPAPCIANLHVCGIDRSRKELGDSTPPGRDAVVWEDLARDLAALGYSGPVTVELAYPSHLDTADIERAYAGIRPSMPGAEDLSRRLSAWGVEFFREKFAVLLKEGDCTK